MEAWKAGDEALELEVLVVPACRQLADHVGPMHEAEDPGRVMLAQDAAEFCIAHQGRCKVVQAHHAQADRLVPADISLDMIILPGGGQPR